LIDIGQGFHLKAKSVQGLGDSLGVVSWVSKWGRMIIGRIANDQSLSDWSGGGFLSWPDSPLLSGGAESKEAKETQDENVRSSKHTPPKQMITENYWMRFETFAVITLCISRCQCIGLSFLRYLRTDQFS